MQSQVTTKRGDTGETTALSGEAYPKSHPIMECVGTLDELRAHTALLRLRILETHLEDAEHLADFLLWLLHAYFLIGSACSDPFRKHPEYRRRDLCSKDLDTLEAEQQRIEEQTQLPHAFIVSAATPLAAQADVTCTVARRFERSVVRLMEAMPGFEPKDVLAFLNRLSDVLYMLARHIEHPHHLAVDYRLMDK